MLWQMNEICTAILLGGAAYTDIRYHKVYNSWLLSFALLGIHLRGMRFMLPMVLTISVLFMLHTLHMIGAGDIKLVAVVMGYLGYSAGVRAIFTGMLCLSAYGAYLLWKRGILLARFRYFGNYMAQSLQTRTMMPYDRSEKVRDMLQMVMAPWFLLGFIIWRIVDICR